MKWITSLLLLLTTFSIFAQEQYASSPRYWKNRKPFAGYWQQDVHYKIDATIDETKNSILATEQLIYTNNSPDALPFVYFHLYQNAFNKDSYLDQLHDANKIKTRHGKYESAGLGTTVDGIAIGGVPCKTELDNTILKVYLPKPLASGEQITFDIKFNTYWDMGSIRRRMQMFQSANFPHYNGVHWYPRISVYDRKKGWDVDQHLNKELYGDFGTFDVKLNFASNYFVEATGILQNKNEVLPADLWEKVQIKNFKNKPYNEPASEIIKYNAKERKTWNYHADFVHDFAFTADPSYRYEEQEVYGVKCVAIAMEQHASKWQSAATYVAKIIKTFSDDFGMYEYPKMVAADANDGMEYPMITLDGGVEPDFHGLFVHEIAHNWFYGMIGNNETYRAALDEGFTQFATGWGLQKIDGDTSLDTKDRRAYIRKHRTGLLVWDKAFLQRYTNDAMRGDDKALNTHSNDFHGGLGHENGYNSVYQKTASMLLNLQYVLGDSLFLKSFQHYVEKWKFGHPYFEDFRESIIEYTHVDLNWFFDQWLETTKTIDYKVMNFSKIKKDNYRITLHRKGEMQMPIDVTITARNGTKYNYHIPNTNWFVKSTTATALSKWYGWDILNPKYVFTANIPGGIQSVQIDSTYRMADAYMGDNMIKRSWLGLGHENDVDTRLDYGLRNVASRRKLTTTHRPDIWWNAKDGIKLGWHAESSYMNYMHKMNADMWWNTGLLGEKYKYATDSTTEIYAKFNYIFNYETPIRKISKKLIVGLHSRIVEGLSKNQVFVNWNFSPSENIKVELTDFHRYYQLDANAKQYQNYATEWDSYVMPINDKNIYGNRPQSSNSFVQMTYNKNYKTKKAFGRYTIIGRTNIPSLVDEINAYNAGYVQGELTYNQNWKKFEMRARLFTRIGMGTNIPTESALYLAGANPEEMSDNKYYRSAFYNSATFNQIQTGGFSNVQMGGGLNLRGYAGYYAVEDIGNNTFMNYKGRSGTSINVEVEFDRYIKLAPKVTRNWLKVDAYIFADAGRISNGTIDLANIYKLLPNDNNGIGQPRVDAGLGSVFTIKHWGKFEKANPLSIRIDCPIFVNTLPNNYTYDYVSVRRWVIGIGRCF